MTDGILLNEIHFDRELTKYDTIIIDEAHERSLTIDFLLGYLKQLLPRRPDLKLDHHQRHDRPRVVLEALRRRAHHRGLGPHLPGRDPLPAARRRRRPRATRTTTSTTTTPGSQATAEAGRDRAARRRQGLPPGHQRRPRRARRARRAATCSSSSPARTRSATPRRRSAAATCRYTEVLPLYGRLSAADQHRVFEPQHDRGHPAPHRPRDQRRRDQPHRARHPVRDRRGHRAHQPLLDPGRRCSACRSRRSRRRAPTSAPAAPAARATASRSASTARQDFEKRPEFTEPEILRTNLAAVILQMISLGLGDIAAFPFLQPPDSRGIKDGLDLLRELGAVTPGRPGSRASASSSRGCRSTRASPAWSSSRRQHGTTREVHGDRRGAQHPGPPRAPAREARPGRPAARALRRPHERLPHPAQPLELPRGEAEGAQRQRVPAPVQATSTSTTCASASGRTSTASSAARAEAARPARRRAAARTPTASTAVAAGRAAQPDRPERPAEEGLRRRPPDALRDLPGLGAREEAAERRS